MKTVDGKLAASRPLGVAQELGAQALDEAIVFARKVILTGEKEALATANGRWCFLDSLRLLSRVVGDLIIVIPEGAAALQAELDTLVPTLWSQRTVRQVAADDYDLADAVAVLNVGFCVHPELPWTSIIANGWVARCTSGNLALPGGCDQENPLSCLLAASLGVTEVFKRVYGVPAEKAAPMENAAFSLFEMSTEFADLGPQLPPTIPIPSTLLLGAGAIGNGLILLAAQLRLEGEMLVMDKQDFGDENYGTCTLLDDVVWLRQPKAEMLAQWLGARSDLKAEGLKAKIEDALDEGKLDGRNFDLVINGLDDVDARRSVQRLWPRLIVDGAINSAGAAVVTHSMAHRDLACLRCAFESTKKDLFTVQADLTGLSRTSLQGNQNRAISDEDIVKASPDRQPWLRQLQQQGKTICSVMQAAHAEGLGLKLKDGFRPSVPFVATTAAALAMAQVLRNLLWREQRFVHTFQMASLFAGPETALAVKRAASTECECTRHAATIDKILAARPLKPVRILAALCSDQQHVSSAACATREERV